MDEHIMKCRKFEVDNKMITGKLGYFKTMWKWLTQREWEVIEEQLQYEQGNNLVNNDSYGTTVY